MNKITFLFSGQGSQYAGMGKDFYTQFAVAKKTFDEANESLGFDLKSLCFEGSIDELTKTENAQPAILTTSIAYYRTFMDRVGITPIVVAGHSLGEYSALVAAGAISFADALLMVRKRGLLMQEAVTLGGGAMAAVGGLSREVIFEECAKINSNDETVVVSNYNSPQQTVISGHAAAVNKAAEKLTELTGRVTFLKVSAPFHSPLMQPAADKMNSELMKYRYNTFKVPVISNVTGRPYASADEIISSLTDQIIKPVMWTDTMNYIERMGVNIAIEMGPKNVLKNLARKNTPSLKAFTYEIEEDRKNLDKTLKEAAGLDGSTNGPTLVTRCMAVAVCTRNHNWDNKEYQKGVSDPYKRIQKMQEEIEASKQPPTVEQMQAALDMLQSVFLTKKTPVEEQIERFEQVFNETGTRHLFPDFQMPSPENVSIVSQ